MSRLALLCVLAAGSIGCGDLEEGADPTGSLELSPNYLTAGVGQTVTLTATYTWADAVSARLAATDDSTAVSGPLADATVAETMGSEGLEFDCLETGEARVEVKLIGVGDNEGSSFDKEIASESATIVCGTPVVDEQEDGCIYSISTVPGTYCPEFVDIQSHSAGVIDATNEVIADFAGEQEACDGACIDSLEDFPVGEAIFVTTVHGADVPAAEPAHSLIYAVVFDSDGDPANNWLTQGVFDWDFFQGTDRWYQASWDHVTGFWRLTVTQVDSNQSRSPFPSRARVLVRDNSVHMLIPRGELSGSAPSYRTTAFGHPGDFDQTDSGGDVAGVDPTSPLFPIPL